MQLKAGKVLHLLKNPSRLTQIVKHSMHSSFVTLMGLLVLSVSGKLHNHICLKTG